VEASVGGIAVRLLDLSAIGARIEHEERFALAAPQLRITWQGRSVSIPVRVARSEIAGRRESRLIYRSGLQFTRSDADAEEVVEAILRSAQPSEPAQPQDKPSLDDSWIRQVNFLRHDAEDELPFAQFRLTPAGWQKAYVASPLQPDDGFTIPRGERDFDEMQRTYELADPETRRMMRIALEAKLGK
jgi:hypothetical protein